MIIRHICGIDIGSSKIAACLGCFRQRELVSLWRDSAAAAGIKAGQWQDVGGLTGVISKVLGNLKSKSGIKIKSVNLGINSQNIVAKHSQAVIALAEKDNRAVTKKDIQNVNQQALILGSCLEHEVLYAQPLSYTIDNENEVINPLGLYGHKLGVNLYLICTRASYINTIIEIINRLGLRINEITLSGIAASMAVFNYDKMKGLNILCDIGKDITQILIFNDDRLIHYQVMSSGGDNLTTSLSGELSIPYSLAEEIKISHGCIQNEVENLGLSSKIHPGRKRESETADKEIIVKKDNAYSTLSQDLINQVISCASRNMAESIRDAIRPHLLAMASVPLPAKATLYVSGRTACLDGFLELLEVVTGIPVKMAKIGNASLSTSLMLQGIVSGEPILNYLTCLGLIAKEINLSYRKSARPIYDLRSILTYIPEKIKQVYQEYF